MHRPVRPLVAAAAVLAPWLTACSPAAPPVGGHTAQPGPLVLTSPDLDADGALPAWSAGRYSTVCDGENRSPALTWQGGPEGVESYVLTLTDPAHPQYVHWVVTGIPGDLAGLDQATEGTLDVGVVGASYRGDGLYAGPCVEGNLYVYTLYALDEDLVGDASTSLTEALALVDGHVVAEATLEVTRAAG